MQDAKKRRFDNFQSFFEDELIFGPSLPAFPILLVRKAG
jgi:hypothetical protein